MQEGFGARQTLVRFVWSFAVVVASGCAVEPVTLDAREVSEAEPASSEGAGASGVSGFARREAKIFWDSFETGGWKAELNKGLTGGSINFGPVWWQSQMQSNDSGIVIHDPDRARHGDHYIRFKWYRSRYGASGISENVSKKAHLWAPRERYTTNARWYRFSVWFDEFGGDDSFPEIVAQWHGVPDAGNASSPPERRETFRVPSLSITHERGRLVVKGYYAPERWNCVRRADDGIEDFCLTRSSFAPFDIGPAINQVHNEYYRWIDFVFRVELDGCGTGGRLEIWRQDVGDPAGYVKVADLADISLGYNDAYAPFLGVGIYKFLGDSDDYKRELFFDNVKIGNERAEFDDMK